MAFRISTTVMTDQIIESWLIYLAVCATTKIYFQCYVTFYTVLLQKYVKLICEIFGTLDCSHTS